MDASDQREPSSDFLSSKAIDFLFANNLLSFLISPTANGKNQTVQVMICGQMQLMHVQALLVTSLKPSALSSLALFIAH